MSQILDELKYTRTHEWVRKEADGTYTIGITDHAQQLLGDIVYVELPEVAHMAEMGQEISVVESVKAAADVYSPLPGEVVAVNEQLSTEPQLVNAQPYGEGWLFKLRSSGHHIEDLLDAKSYKAHIEA
jgi:glycine cleavage system H protein